jgi:hypothetical protein
MSRAAEPGDTAASPVRTLEFSSVEDGAPSPGIR